MKLSTLLIVGFMSLAAILTVFATYTLFLNSENALTNQVYDHLMTAAQSRAEHIKTYLKEEKKTAEVMADSAVVRNLLLELSSGTPPEKDIQDVQARLNGLLSVSTDYNEAFVLDKKGVIIASSNEATIGGDKSQDSIFIYGKNGTYMKDLYLSNITKKPAIAISSPIFDNQKGFIGVFAIRFYMDSLNSITAESTGLGDTGEIVLVNINKYAVTALRYRNDSVPSKIETDLVNKCIADLKEFGTPGGEIEEHEEGILHYKDYRGIGVVGTHAYIQPQMDWCLIAKIDESEALGEPMGRLAGISLITCIITLAFVFAGTLFISRRIAKPIDKLTSNVDAITKGNLDIHLEKSGISEVQRLTDSLNRILASLKLAILRTGMSKADMGLGEAIAAKESAEAKYKLLYESSSDAIMTLEPPDWRFTAGNPAAIKMFGVAGEKEFVSLGPGDLSPEHQPDGQLSSVKAKKNIELAMKNGANLFEWTHKKYNGEDFPATVLLTRVTAGDKTFLQATVRDITERKKDGARLEAASGEWKKTFDALQDPIFIQDTDFKFVKANKAFLDFVKMSEKDLIGKKCYEVLHKLNRPWPKCPTEEALRDKKPHTEEVGDVNIGYRLSVSSSPILNDKGDVTGIVHIARVLGKIEKKK